MAATARARWTKPTKGWPVGEYRVDIYLGNDHEGHDQRRRRLFRSLVTSASPDEDLTGAINKWCKQVEKLADRKHLWLKWATYLFMVSSVITLLVLIVAMQNPLK